MQNSVPTLALILYHKEYKSCTKACKLVMVVWSSLNFCEEMS